MRSASTSECILYRALNAKLRNTNKATKLANTRASKGRGVHE